MSFHVFPKGDDRSWTREKYYAMNRLFRWLEYKDRLECENLMQEAIEEMWATGRGMFKVPWRGPLE